jgi:uncharacterized membrane protein
MPPTQPGKPPAVGRPWLRWLLTVLVVAAVTHLLVLWLLPRQVMKTAISRATGPVGTVLRPPLADASSRAVVMPSPDLLYATCALDLTQRPQRVRARLNAPGYASVALYASNSDNVFVINDLQLAGRPLDLWLVGPDANPDGAPPGSTLIRLPSATGMLLMRVLVPDRTHDLPRAEAVRETLRCDPV